jgi:hypothetical protein
VTDQLTGTTEDVQQRTPTLENLCTPNAEGDPYADTSCTKNASLGFSGRCANFGCDPS